MSGRGSTTQTRAPVRRVRAGVVSMSQAWQRGDLPDEVRGPAERSGRQDGTAGGRRRRGLRSRTGCGDRCRGTRSDGCRDVLLAGLGRQELVSAARRLLALLDHLLLEQRLQDAALGLGPDVARLFRLVDGGEDADLCIAQLDRRGLLGGGLRGDRRLGRGVRRLGGLLGGRLLRAVFFGAAFGLGAGFDLLLVFFVSVFFTAIGLTSLQDILA